MITLAVNDKANKLLGTSSSIPRSVGSLMYTYSIVNEGKCNSSFNELIMYLKFLIWIELLFHHKITQMYW
jgi:hypothetical protein